MAAAGGEAADPAVTPEAVESTDDPGSDQRRSDRPSKKRDRDRDRTSKRDLVVAAKENAPLPPSDGTASSDPGKDTPADCTLPDKDIAREAWRRNWPTVCSTSTGEKAFIVIPLKGTLDGEVHELRRRPSHEARIVLPSGSESQLTMKQYKVQRLGFKEVRIGTMEDGRTRVRVRLEGDSGDAVFEIKDGYAKVTIAPPGRE